MCGCVPGSVLSQALALTLAASHHRSQVRSLPLLSWGNIVYVLSASLSVIVPYDACRNSGYGESCRGAAVRVVSAPWTGLYGRTPRFGGNREDGRRGMEGHRGVCYMLLVVLTCWTAVAGEWCLRPSAIRGVCLFGG